MGTTIKLEVSYSQLAVFVSSLSRPFNIWTDQHVLQGFAWRPGSVSFRSIIEAGRHEVEIDVVNHMSAVHSDTLRAVEVPFEVPVDGAVEVGSITETIPLSLPSGLFLLRCEFLSPSDKAMERARLTFAKDEATHFEIVRADPSLSIDGPLLTTANPA